MILSPKNDEIRYINAVFCDVSSSIYWLVSVVLFKVGKTSVSLRTKPVGVVLSSRFIESLLKRNSYFRSNYNNNVVLVNFLRFVLAKLLNQALQLLLTLLFLQGRMIVIVIRGL